MRKIKNRLLLAVLTMISGVILSIPISSHAATLYWPVPGHTQRSQGFHDGKAIDISDGSIAGADVIAAMGGNVTAIYLCSSQHYGSTGDCNGFGTGIVIKGDDGRFYQYAHMQGGSVPSNVHYGARVSAGQKIGKVGTTGNSSGNHLHFGISIGNYWNNSGINPMNESYIYNAVHTHTYTNSVTKQPTCTEQGVKTFRCSCGASYTEAVSAKGHSYKTTVVAPTITEQGYTLHTCSVCGGNYKDNFVSPPMLNADGWYYCDVLPAGISAEEYTIERQNCYVKIQADSPGADWKNEGKARDTWENSGGQYNTETDLPTSDSRILVRSVYYHFCGPNAGNEGNYEQTGKFVHYDDVPAARVIVRSSGMDNGHPYYLIDWNDGGGRVYCRSGVTCDGSYGSHGARCQAWYKMNTYQDRVHIVQYKFTKASEWGSAIDAAANTVKIRFKQKNTDKEEEQVTPPADREEQVTLPVDREEQVTPPVDREEQVTPPVDRKEQVTPPVDREEQVTPPVDKKVETPRITPARVTNLSVKAVKGRKIKIYWKNAKNANKYQIQIALNKSFKKGKKQKTISTNWFIWKKLKKGSTYYVRIRGCNRSSNNYGRWSSVKKVKVRK